MARGGARPGAGAPKGDRNGMRKLKMKVSPPGEYIPAAEAKTPPDRPIEEIPADLTPLDHFLKVIRDPTQSPDRRDRAAAVLLPFMHEKAGAKKGKKEEQDEKAKTAASGRYAVPAPPKLTVAK